MLKHFTLITTALLGLIAVAQQDATSESLPDLACASPSTLIEQTICQHETLIHIHQDINRVHTKLLTRFKALNYDTQTLQQTQQTSLLDRENCAQDKYVHICLLNLMGTRLDDLTKLLELGTRVARDVYGGRGTMDQAQSSEPLTWQYVAAGSADVAEYLPEEPAAQHGHCTGYISTPYDYQLVLGADTRARLEVESAGDTVLFIIRQEDKAIFCSDDYQSFHPSVLLEEPGNYNVRVGTFFQHDRVPYTASVRIE